MMTILMVDVEAGKEDLFDRLHQRLVDINESETANSIQPLYLARCFTHSDVSIIVDIKDTDALSRFITEGILNMEGVWDFMTIYLLNPHFFRIPDNVDLEKTGHFTVTLDVKSDKTEAVFNQIRDLASTDEAAISFMAYTFHSFDNDIIFSLLAPDISLAGKFVDEKIRTIDGVHDTFLWQLSKCKFVVPQQKWLDYINYIRKTEKIDFSQWKDQFNELAASYVCAC
jgi:DNA-binding Lrp family transcriptional regulator